MAKRARGTVRPGQRRPATRRPAATPAAQPAATPATAAPKPTGLSEAELERAAQIEAQLLADEKAAEQARKRSRERGTVTRDVVGTGTLAVRAEQEYAYVGRDLRDIARIAALELGLLAVLYILVDVTHVVKIGG